MQPRSLAFAAALAGALAISIPGSAQAAAGPMVGELTDAGGATNGCYARAASLVTMTDPNVNTPGIGIRVRSYLTCEAAANVHRATFDTVLDEVLPDGSTRTVVPLSRTLRGSWSPVSMDGKIATTQWKACTADMSGTHTYRFRVTMKTKQTLGDSDTSPFIARLERTQTVTCP